MRGMCEVLFLTATTATATDCCLFGEGKKDTE